jgi:glycosyltransferase involved in cell wall biosynthesis
MIDDTNVKVKVLLVGPIPPPYGGIPAYVKSLYDAELEDIEYDLFNTANPSWVEPLSREGKRSYFSIFESGILPAIKKIVYIFSTFISFIRYLSKNKTDIVQVFTCTFWGYWRNWVYVLIARFFHKKTIFHLLGAIDLFYSEVGNVQKFLIEKSLNSADYYLLQSPGLEAWAKKYSRKMVAGIWNGIDFTKIPNKKEMAPVSNCNLPHPIGLTIGNLSENKGTLDIISALAEIKVEIKEFSWIFVGYGDVRKYEEIVMQKGLSEYVHFAGIVSEFEKWQYLQNASIFCLPSYAEGQPISIIEAMACSLPIISSRVGSIPEMISEGISGSLISPGDITALKNEILNLANNPKLCTTMGANSLKICQERHNIHDLFNNLLKIYSQLFATK